MVALRAFDGLDADAILALGWDRLREEHEARAAAAREIDADADELTVIDRVKSDQPATFDDALDAYRSAMLRSRQHLIDHDLVTVPDDERIDVIPTPEYLRNVIPFAAYFEPATFDRDPKGIYIVTPSIHDDPNAMREHNYASISNTSIHEAYPGPPSPARRRAAKRVAQPAPRRRARVHRGLGDVLGAPDARARLR